jgi:hypothetical protein
MTLFFCGVVWMFQEKDMAILIIEVIYETK